MQQKQACDLPESQEFVGGIEAFEEYEESQDVYGEGEEEFEFEEYDSAPAKKQPRYVSCENVLPQPVHIQDRKDGAPLQSVHGRN